MQCYRARSVRGPVRTACYVDHAARGILAIGFPFEGIRLQQFTSYTLIVINGWVTPRRPDSLGIRGVVGLSSRIDREFLLNHNPLGLIIRYMLLVLAKLQTDCDPFCSGPCDQVLEDWVHRGVIVEIRALPFCKKHKVECAVGRNQIDIAHISPILHLIRRNEPVKQLRICCIWNSLYMLDRRNLLLRNSERRYATNHAPKKDHDKRDDADSIRHASYRNRNPSCRIVHTNSPCHAIWEDRYSEGRIATP